ncbi:hypothetical protein DICPUDRAFT_84097 [Dictyostelium purpureum]|uniref:Uncharacterized protein n=1 Tax=Dictyostelium purpureum TaxID=5786 RepID=F1A1K7_DICPU|nr:uncharacterized protein DICPUDRAFT_84097 [Dictyostelium purpureum]EGC29926.1 hypothetical protein DICPUDRAFT_84097 [Dictyostelium purpureum]|eukprot:XP_003293548.1 hypothetical protein DICPUDRAFT_84097 [Dictyostelium purpureum]
MSTTKHLSKLFPALAKNKRDGQNFLDICFSLSNKGVGTKICKKNWSEPETYWTVTKTKFINSPLTNNAMHGKAFGILTWNGKTDNKEQEITNSLDKNWSLYPYSPLNITRTVETEEQPAEESTEQQ